MAAALALIGALAVLNGCSTGTHDIAAGELPLAAVYRGPAACQGCPEAAASLLEESGDFDVEFIGPDEERAVTSDGLRDVDLYVQPGGFDDVARAMADLGDDATTSIPAWVEQGGRYLGLCMGAYLAGSDPGLGLLAPGDTAGYAESEGALVDGDEEAVVPVDWGGERRLQYAQEPAVIIESGVAGERVLSRFTNGEVNALVMPRGEGAVAVVGTHPEATDDWFSPALARADVDGPDHEQALELVAALMAVR